MCCGEVGVIVWTGPCKNLGGPYKVLVRTFSITGSLWEPCLGDGATPSDDCPAPTPHNSERPSNSSGGLNVDDVLHGSPSSFSTMQMTQGTCMRGKQSKQSWLLTSEAVLSRIDWLLFCVCVPGIFVYDMSKCHWKMCACVNCFPVLQCLHRNAFRSCLLCCGSGVNAFHLAKTTVYKSFVNLVFYCCNVM